MTARRSWFARARCGELEPFCFGTVSLPADAKDHEVRAALEEQWRKSIPHPPPPFTPQPGAIIVVEEEA